MGRDGLEWGSFLFAWSDKRLILDVIGMPNSPPSKQILILTILQVSFTVVIIVSVP